jgi:hypothetical protein
MASHLPIVQLRMDKVAACVCCMGWVGQQLLASQQLTAEAAHLHILQLSMDMRAACVCCMSWVEQQLLASQQLTVEAAHLHILQLPMDMRAACVCCMGCLKHLQGITKKKIGSAGNFYISTLLTICAMNFSIPMIADMNKQI